MHLRRSLDRQRAGVPPPAFHHAALRHCLQHYPKLFTPGLPSAARGALWEQVRAQKGGTLGLGAG